MASKKPEVTGNFSSSSELKAGALQGYRHIRDCLLFMPKGGSVIFKQFRHMKNLPLPGSGYFKKLPPLPFMWQAQNVTSLPHPAPLRTRCASDCEIAYNTCSGRLPINQNPLQLIFVKEKNLWVLCALLKITRVRWWCASLLFWRIF